ncbi:MAG: SLBB domain-containing protein [Bacteroidota bacterium]
MKQFFLSLVLCLAGYGVVDAQVFNGRETDLDRSRYGQAAVYKYAEQGDVTVAINVWGTVRNPGLYELPEGATLNDVVSMAGGPANFVYDPTRSDRKITIEVARRTDGGYTTIVESDLDALVGSSEMIMQDGDVIFLETLDRQRFNLRNYGLPLASLALGVVGIAINLTR